jgi:hypothetical protein
MMSGIPRLQGAKSAVVPASCAGEIVNRTLRWLRANEAPALQPLREQACTLTVMPDHLDEATFAPAKDEEITTVRIGFELPLYQQRQTGESFAHGAVAVASCLGRSQARIQCRRPVRTYSRAQKPLPSSPTGPLAALLAVPIRSKQRTSETVLHSPTALARNATSKAHVGTRCRPIAPNQ